MNDNQIDELSYLLWDTCCNLHRILEIVDNVSDRINTKQCICFLGYIMKQNGFEIKSEDLK